ncbi:MAG TPA: biotin/lipoyl-binding protein, partial [Gemmataceae bacterium]
MTTRQWLLVAAVVTAGVIGYFAWEYFRPPELPPGFAGSNGRIEATEIDIATKIAGRVEEIFVDEGDFVSAGQVVARMDTEVLTAQLREAEAQLRQAKTAVKTARSTVEQREREKAAAESVVAQRDAQLAVAKTRFARSISLAVTGAASAEQREDDRAAFYAAQAALDAARANVAAADAAIATARSQVIEAEAAVEASRATIDRIRADIEDSALKAPRNGRVQYRVAQPGEVLGAGGRVLNM